VTACTPDSLSLRHARKRLGGGGGGGGGGVSQREGGRGGGVWGGVGLVVFCLGGGVGAARKGAGGGGGRGGGGGGGGGKDGFHEAQRASAGSFDGRAHRCYSVWAARSGLGEGRDATEARPIDLVTPGHCSSPGRFSGRFRAGERPLVQTETREMVLIMRREIES